MTIIQPSNDNPAGLGPVPTLGGSTTTNIPSSPTATTPTTQQQSAIAVTQSIQQAVFLPPAPTWSALLNPNGSMTAPWVTWFQVLNRKLGGYSATPTDDAQILADDGLRSNGDVAIASKLAQMGVFDKSASPFFDEDSAKILFDEPNRIPYWTSRWTPTVTIDGGTVSTVDGRFTKIGNRVDFALYVTGTGMVESGPPSSRFNLPFVPTRYGAAVVTNTSLASYSPALISTNGYCYLPSISSTSNFIVSGTLFLRG